jgi:DNA-directed RNA polymerase specialized sigma24 family protein
MASDGSVTKWLGRLKDGDPAAVQQIWERYFNRLVGLARRKLGGAHPRVADEEDIALSAIDSFCRNAENGRFPQLMDRDGLWRLLVVITARKVFRLIRDQSRQKRGRRATESAQMPLDLPNLEEILSREPSPLMAAQIGEEYRRLLGLLDDPELESVALARMDGYSVDEIADKIGKAPRSVKRKLHLIRELWEKDMSVE